MEAGLVIKKLLMKLTEYLQQKIILTLVLSGGSHRIWHL